jgi:hypothetical protein
VHISHLSHARAHPNIIWLKVPIMKLILMRFSFFFQPTISSFLVLITAMYTVQFEIYT